MVRRVKMRPLRHEVADEQVEKLARAAHGFVGADLAALCSEAAMTALRRVVAGATAAGAPSDPKSKPYAWSCSPQSLPKMWLQQVRGGS